MKLIKTWLERHLLDSNYLHAAVAHTFDWLRSRSGCCWLVWSRLISVSVVSVSSSLQVLHRSVKESEKIVLIAAQSGPRSTTPKHFLNIHPQVFEWSLNRRTEGQTDWQTEHSNQICENINFLVEFGLIIQLLTVLVYVLLCWINLL